MAHPTNTYDCLLIGGGVIGLMTARELLSRGQSVAVIDRSAVGLESSWAGGGILFPVDPGQLSQAGMALVTWSRNAYQALAQELFDETGTDSEWAQSGCIVKDRGQGDAIIEWVQSHGLQASRIGDKELRTLAPALRNKFGDSVWLPDVAQIRNPRLLQALKQSIVQRGGAIFERAPLKSIQIEQGRAVSVQSNDQKFHADKIIVSAGAWTTELIKPYGPAPLIEPVRGQMICFQAQADWVKPILMEGDYYLIPRNDGRILAGSTVERVGFDKSTTQQAFDALRHAAVHMLPQLEHVSVEIHWAGLRPSSPDGVPTIAEHPEIEGLYVNAGHYRNGLVMAPASARLMAELALGQTPTFDPAPYAAHFTSTL